MTELERLSMILSDFRDSDGTEIRDFQFPPLSLFRDYDDKIERNFLDSRVLQDKLREFGFEGTVEDIKTGPVITRYEIRLASGVRLSQIRKVSEDLAIALMSDKIRIQAPIPGTSLVGIEVVNKKPATIGIKGIIQKSRESFYQLPLAIGQDTVGNSTVIDLTKLPHLLIAGATGSGKSVGLNSMILSLLYTKDPKDLQLLLVDPKRIEMSSYSHIPHLRWPVITDPEEALQVFRNLISEMETRFDTFSDMGVRNIESYNKRTDNKLPYIVVVIDEMADLMMTSGKDLESMIVRIAQLSRAVGIHMIMATQKPSVKVITGLIKSNMPSRISYRVASKNDSRVILDSNGAEKLIGRGDMLMIHPGSSEPERFHGAWVSDEEIESVTNFLRGER